MLKYSYCFILSALGVLQEELIDLFKSPFVIKVPLQEAALLTVGRWVGRAGISSIGFWPWGKDILLILEVGLIGSGMTVSSNVGGVDSFNARDFFLNPVKFSSFTFQVPVFDFFFVAEPLVAAGAAGSIFLYTENSPFGNFSKWYEFLSPLK